jgi:hypothetical protein
MNDCEIDSLYYILYYNILTYAPGELHMEPETEGCLYPCGGAI